MIADVGRWLREGKLCHAETVVDGLENTVAASIDLLRGANAGKISVRPGQTRPHADKPGCEPPGEAGEGAEGDGRQVGDGPVHQHGGRYLDAWPGGRRPR